MDKPIKEFKPILAKNLKKYVLIQKLQEGIYQYVYNNRNMAEYGTGYKDGLNAQIENIVNEVFPE